MKKSYLKKPKVTYDFIYSLWFIYNEYIWWEWEENPEIRTKENQGKNSPFGCPPIPPSMKMEADCFPVSENTENKPDLP